ncbi:gamma-glutamyltranspeptidase [Novosphingobium pentaromativorans US6-1]|uniref:Gamma-glutamyltranspeptidase n=2 Tax=Novosphingobium pentaromativorans TaxID=205844 RepID=G6EER6_9SPHN|nr:gamma-glutamyltranspeptidase [Novosphingobium pentaromativorans US6-1]
MMSAPHGAAAQAGRDILRAGGSAIEAMVAAAATIAVVYPHMNALGGDGFWLIHRPGEAPVAISGCGRSAMLATDSFYEGTSIPARGGPAALTVAGTISGWAEALSLMPKPGLPLRDLLAAAIAHAREGIIVTRSQHELTTAKVAELQPQPGFARTFMPGGKAPGHGEVLRQPELAATLERLAQAGLDDFYRGDIARSLAKGLEGAGSPLRLADLESQRAQRVAPLSVRCGKATLFNHPPPTQGVASLMILALMDRLALGERDSFAHVHAAVEATKRAFLLRDAHVGDPAFMAIDPRQWLEPAFLAQEAGRIDPARALPWPVEASTGDTIWMGAADRDGTVVSFIQSIFWEFGSGVVVDGTGVLWQNRGSSFTLTDGPNRLSPGRLPFHTLNPALALFDDGRVMSYGTMGGDGQPQTQAAIFSRYAFFGQGLQEAISAPRWLLGKTWGEESATLKLESRFPAALFDSLAGAGHRVERLPDYSDTMGHAGAVVAHGDGRFEGASDPRADGCAAPA